MRVFHVGFKRRASAHLDPPVSFAWTTLAVALAAASRRQDGVRVSARCAIARVLLEQGGHSALCGTATGQCARAVIMRLHASRSSHRAPRQALLMREGRARGGAKAGGSECKGGGGGRRCPRCRRRTPLHPMPDLSDLPPHTLPPPPLAIRDFTWIFVCGIFLSFFVAYGGWLRPTRAHAALPPLPPRGERDGPF